MQGNGVWFSDSGEGLPRPAVVAKTVELHRSEPTLTVAHLRGAQLPVLLVFGDEGRRRRCSGILLDAVTPPG